MNELMIKGWCYWKTDKTTAKEALDEFHRVCEKIGIDSDNMECAILRDEDYEDIDRIDG